jgi:hypothetical protein
MPIYDDFSEPELNGALWEPRRATAFAAVTGDLKLTCANGECGMELGLKDRGAGLPATLYTASRMWQVGREPMSFSSTMASMCNVTDDNGIGVAFGVFDPDSGTIIGIAATGSSMIAIARESPDPLAPLAELALEFTDLGVLVAPLRRCDVKIEYDPIRRIARWYVDDVLRLYREVPFDPRQFTCGFGLLPLRPLGSAHAELTLRALWGPIQWEDEGELDPDAAYSAMPG